MGRLRLLSAPLAGVVLLCAWPASADPGVCLKGYITDFTAFAGETLGGFAPNFSITINGVERTIGKEKGGDPATASFYTIRNAAQAAFLSVTPVQLISTANCNDHSPRGSYAFTINTCLSATGCGIPSPVARPPSRPSPPSR